MRKREEPNLIAMFLSLPNSVVRGRDAGYCILIQAFYKLVKPVSALARYCFSYYDDP